MSYINTSPIVTGTWSTISALSAPIAGQLAYVTDVGSGVVFLYNGTRWKPVGGRITLASLDMPVTGITNTEAFTLQSLMPSGFWQIGDRLRFYQMATRNNTTDNITYNVRIGTTGVVSGGGADTVVLNGITVLSSTQLQTATFHEIALQSATSALMVATNSFGYSNGTGNAIPAAVTISNVSNALYVSMTLKSASTSSTAGAQGAVMEYIASAN